METATTAEAVERQQQGPRQHHGLWLWGDNRFGLHPEAREDVVAAPRPVAFFDDKVLRSVSLGVFHAAAVDQDGSVYEWGAGAPAAVAAKALTVSSDAVVPVNITSGTAAPARPQQPRLLLKGYDATDVFCGLLSTYVLTDSGQIFAVPYGSETTARDGKSVATSGNGSWSWWPFGSWTAAPRPKVKLPVPANASELTLPQPANGSSVADHVVKLTGGLHHLLALTSTGKVFSASQDAYGNEAGQLGLGHTDVVAPVLHEVDLSGAQVVDVACGLQHSAVLTRDGDVYTFGANRLCQLGLGPGHDGILMVSKPRRMLLPKITAEPPPKATRVAAGGDTTFVMFDSSRLSQVYAVGSGLHGQLGHGQWQHVRGDAGKVRQISDRSYYDEQEKQVRAIRIKYLSAGLRHVAAVLDTGYSSTASDDVFTWGYNKQYQLGLDNSLSSPTPTATKALVSGVDALRLAADHGKTMQRFVCGYDTSAVFTVHR